MSSAPRSTMPPGPLKGVDVQAQPLDGLAEGDHLPASKLHIGRTIAAMCACLFAALPVASASAATTERVSVASDGTYANDESYIWRQALSQGGRFVVFESDAANLVPNDTWAHDVFVHDRDLDRDGIFDEPGAMKTVRVDLSTKGAQADNSGYNQNAISPGGRFVAFLSEATNLVPGDTNGIVDIFVRDRNTDRDRLFDERGAVKTVRVSLSTSGQQANDYSWFPTLTTGGRFVAFESYASNLVPGDDNLAWDIFVRDRDTDRDGRFDEPGAVKTVRLSVSTDGAQADSDSTFANISRDGRFVVFRSWADNLVPGGDTNGVADAFVRDRDSDQDGRFDEPGAVTTVRLTSAWDGGEIDGDVNNPVVSGSGRFVAFQSAATNLVSDDTNGVDDVFVHDRDTDGDGIFDEPGAVKTLRVDVSSDGAESNGATSGASISSNGRFVAFESGATNLVASDAGGFYDTFVRDRDTDEDGIYDEPGVVATIRTSLSTIGDEPDNHAYTAVVSGDGRWAVFNSSARNLDPYGYALGVFARGPLH
jgi:hypothetical protein